jgi:aminopeptidase N
MAFHSARLRLVAWGASAALAVALAPGVPAVARPAVAVVPKSGSSSAGDPYFPLYGNGGINVSSYHLNLRYDPSTDILTGQASLRIRPTRDLNRFNLDLVGLSVRSITVNGYRAMWNRSRNHELTIIPRTALRKGIRFTLVVNYDGKPRTFSDPSLGTYGFLTTDDGAIAVGEPEVAAFWYPVNDHPKDKASYRITLTVPEGLQAISNGLPSATKVSGGWATTTWRHKHRMASYLAFMAVGHFDVHRYTAAGMPIIDAVDPSIPANVRRAVNASFAKQGRILTAESKWFGRYPFETAGGVVDKVPVGFALENQTRPTYASGFWGDEKEAFPNDNVVVHELAHQWYGDSVALSRWQDIWLNEGFATYAEWMWTQQEEGISTADIFDAIYDGIPASNPFWKVKIGDPGRARVFDLAVYLRGGMTLEGLRQKVGRDTFLRILQTWAREHRDGHGTTKQFIALAERLSKRQLDAHFKAWLSTPGKPERPANAARAAASSSSATSSKAQQRAAREYVTRWRADLERQLAGGHHR